MPNVLHRSLQGQVVWDRFRIDWSHPLTFGLSYFKVLNNPTLPPDYIQRGTDGGLLRIATEATSLSPCGIGQFGALRSADSTNKFGFSQTGGSVIAYVSAGFAANDGVAHYVFGIGHKNFVANQTFDFLKFSDNNWYGGWAGSPENRAIGAATGTFNAGDNFGLAVTYSSAGTNIYVKGVVAATRATAAAVGDLTGTSSVFAIAGAEFDGTSPWATVSGRDAVYYLGIYDRVLLQDEIIYLHGNPFCFLMKSEPEMSIMLPSAAPVTNVFRRTASRIGTRTGARQTWAA